MIREENLETIAKNIAFIGQRDVLNIPGLSITTARKIVKYYNSNAVKKNKQNVIFMMELEDFENLPGVSEMTARKILGAISSARGYVKFPQFVAACCIPGVDKKVGELLQANYDSLDDVYHALFVAKDREGLLGISGLGVDVVDALLSEEFYVQWVNLIAERVSPVFRGVVL